MQRCCGRRAGFRHSFPSAIPLDAMADPSSTASGKYAEERATEIQSNSPPTNPRPATAPPLRLLLLPPSPASSKPTLLPTLRDSDHQEDERASMNSFQADRGPQQRSPFSPVSQPLMNFSGEGVTANPNAPPLARIRSSRGYDDTGGQAHLDWIVPGLQNSVGRGVLGGLMNHSVRTLATYDEAFN
jgi:hypothetical protein